MSEFGATFERSFVLHQALSTAINEARSVTVKLSEVVRHLGTEASDFEATELEAAIVSAAEDTSTSIVIIGPRK